MAEGKFSSTLRARSWLAALVQPASWLGRRWIIPALVLLVGWTLSGWIFFALERERLRRDEQFLAERAAEAQAVLLQRLNTSVDALRGGVSFFAASSDIHREEWRAYAESLRLDARGLGVNGIGVIFVVPLPETEAWLKRIRADGMPGFQIHPFPSTQTAPGDPQYIITYSEPEARNRVALGRNIATEPSRRAAAEEARDSGDPRMHQRLAGSRDMQRRSGLLLYMPLYVKGADTSSVAGRRAAHLGWVYAQVQPDVLLEKVLGPFTGMVTLQFFEAGEMSPERLLYASEKKPAAPAHTFERITRLEFAGRRFQLGWNRGPRFPPADRSAGVGAAASLGFATLLLAGLVATLQATGRQANAIAAERTAELAASEERFRQAFEFAGTGMAIVGLDGRLLRVNQALCDIVGFESGELRQKRFQDITHPVDLDGDLALVEELLRGRRRFYHMDKRYIRRDGRTVWVTITVSLVHDAQGAPVQFIGQVVEITARKESEQALRASQQMFQRLFESSPDALILADQGGGIVQANSRADLLFGWPAGGLVGRRVDDLMPERFRPAHAGHMAAYFLDPQPRPMGRGLELQGVRRDGHEFSVDITLSAVETTAGMQTLAVVRDVTERRRLEADVSRARDAAVTASRMKSEFLASMSHEMRTPMNAIIGMAGLLADSPMTADQRSMLRVMQGGAENLLALVNDILDLSKIEAGKLRLEPADFDLRLLIEETLALLTPRAREKGLSVTADFAIGGALWLVGDAARVRQILTNLVGNAVKFTERGEVRVTASIVTEDVARVHCRLVVRDTGVGIPQQVQPLLFQPFVQGTGRKAEGTGLGLVISRQLAELMHGEIGFESEEGRGSTFWFEVELPRADAGAEAPLDHGRSRRSRPAERDLPGLEMPAATPTAAPLRVLLAEDNQANQAVMRRLLARFGCEVDVTANGQQAIARLAATRYDVVLMDCQMPVLDGYEAARRIRSGEVSDTNTQVPIIAVTAYAMGDDRAKCLAAGMDDYVTKPIRTDELCAALERCGLGGRLRRVPDEPPADSDPGRVLEERTLERLRTLPGERGPSLLPEVIEQYLSDEPAALAALESFAAAGERDRLAEVAHAFAGNAAALGALPARDAALALETAARREEPSAWSERLAAVRTEVARMRKALERYLT